MEDDRFVDKDSRDVLRNFSKILDKYSERYTGREEQVWKVLVVWNILDVFYKKMPELSPN